VAALCDPFHFLPYTTLSSLIPASPIDHHSPLRYYALRYSPHASDFYYSAPLSCFRGILVYFFGIVIVHLMSAQWPSGATRRPSLIDYRPTTRMSSRSSVFPSLLRCRPHFPFCFSTSFARAIVSYPFCQTLTFPFFLRSSYISVFLKLTGALLSRITAPSF